ncbi:uncharacterized protein [Misgurnus anguillicaudatus]|uniref:uncharacterized protein isoform X1 n=3 Tax=Misgurnus anguillicaudatus TaxID=75329 RepID=UPI003CCF5C16
MAERGLLWSDQETKLLIAIWADKNIQRKMDSTKRNKMVFEEIAKKMSENGVSRTAKQCRIKLKALKTDYKKIIDHNNRSGRERRTFKFFEEMDRVLRDNPSCHPAFVFDSSSEIDVTGEDVSSPESDMENPNEESTVEVCSPGCSVSAATSGGEESSCSASNSGALQTGETVDQGSRNPTARHAGRTKKRKLDQMRSLMDEWGQRFMSASSKEFEELMRREQLRDEEERQERECRMSLMRALTNSLQAQTQHSYHHTSQNMYLNAQPPHIHSHTSRLQYMPTNQHQPAYSSYEATTSAPHINTPDSFYCQLEEE